MVEVQRLSTRDQLQGEGHFLPQLFCPAHPGWSVDVTGVVSDLQGAQRRRQDAGHQRGRRTPL